MRSLAFITPGAAWTDDGSVYDQDPRVLGDRLVAIRDLFDTGALILGGPAHDGRTGIALFETATSAEARSLIEADPAVRTSIFDFRIQRYTPYFDAFNDTRSTR
jgi:uncharacterized protein YciI